MQKNLDIGVYECTLECELKNVIKQGEGWKYGFKITETSQKMLDNWNSTVYDRPPTFVKEIKNNITFLNVIQSNFLYRRKKFAVLFKNLPNIALNREALTQTGVSVWIDNFSYRYLYIEKNRKLKGGPIIIPIDKFYQLHCSLVENPAQNSDLLLYKITNVNQLLIDKKFRKSVNQWISDGLPTFVHNQIIRNTA